MKVKRLLSCLLVSIIAVQIVIPTFAYSNSEANQLPVDAPSFTINFESSSVKKAPSSTAQYANFAKFCQDSQMNYQLYMDWISQQDLDHLTSITFTIVENETPAQSPQSTNAIQGDRLVYASANYIVKNNEKRQLSVGQTVVNALNELISIFFSQYSSRAVSIANVFGINNPTALFGSSMVQQGKDYTLSTVNVRRVTIFAELYAPIGSAPNEGSPQWYAWGYATSDYVANYIDLYHEGLRVNTSETLNQTYTQSYYNTSRLVSLAKNAYNAVLRHMYQEVTDPAEASRVGYSLYSVSNISKSKYEEYANKC